MIRGTTPTLGAFCSMDLTAFKNICAVWQGETMYEIEPTVERMDNGGCIIYVTLTQEQTLSFKAQKLYHAMMRSVDANGFAVASADFVGYVYDVKPDGVIEYTGNNTRSVAPVEEQVEEYPVDDPPVEEQTEENWEDWQERDDEPIEEPTEPVEEEPVEEVNENENER